MLRKVTPISRLFADPHVESEIVAAGAGRQIDWKTFARDVAGLATRISSSGGHRWLIADADAYGNAVGVLGALQAECQPMLPANLQHGHLADLAATADGMISTSEPFPDATNWLRTFDPDAPSDVSSLHPLDRANVEIVLHTSGTTGVPVAVHKPLRCLEAEVSDVAETFSPEPGRMTLATVPPYHIYGFIYRVLWPLSTSRPFFADMISYPEELISTAKEYSGGMLISSPAFLRRALPVLDLDHLKRLIGPVLSSGGPLPPTVAAAYNAVLSQPVYEIYGSTETGGIAFRSVTDAGAPPHWQPLPSVEVALDSGQEVLAIRSTMLPGNDWALTSDSVRLHSDGRFELMGRADRVVKIEEKRVSLPEVEHRLNECPTVEAARVVVLAGEDDKRQILAAVIEPSIAGWEMLANEGRESLRSLLLDALNPYLATIVLPRKWRFVTRIPEDDRGKTSNSALSALFDENQVRSVEPDIVGRELEQDKVILHLHLPEDLFYFDGHFDEAPILAGVVQIDWAIAYGKAHFKIPHGFRRIEALKFFKVLMAGDDVKLDLSFDRVTGRLNFQYSGRETMHSSGRIVFEATP